ncbi:PepSY domain-containing protein [Merdibacter massiliensis]|uniref:PepSY domain-containing protein n=1 Tax=Merdibacter massiliensis TaxID=1871030 RepID=UPI00096A57CA|nr:PepSY domain-containing protein [Merdibacter massiliensis]
MKQNIFYIISIIFLIICLSGCGSNMISSQEAEQLALDSTGTAKEEIASMKIESSTLDGKDTYVVVFSTSEKTYQVILTKENGEILRSSFQSIPSSPAQSDNDTTGNDSVQNSADKTLEDAKNIALHDAGIDASAVTFTKEETEHEDGFAVYEIEFQTTDAYYEYKISTSGTILESDQELFDYRNATGNEITIDEAKQLVLAKANSSNSNNLYIKEEWDDGMHLYKGELYENNAKYEFEIDASSGTFLEWSMDYRD